VRKGASSERQFTRAQDNVLARSLSSAHPCRTLAASRKVDAAIAAAALQSVNAALRRRVKADQFVFALRGELKP
jgi:hypothetical protein